MTKVFTVKPLKKTADWYKESRAMPITAFRFWIDHSRKVHSKNPEDHLALFACRLDSFEAAWGEPAFRFANSEHLLKAWVLEITETVQLVAFSAKGFGTTFEIVGGSSTWPPSIPKEAETEIIELLTEVARSFKEQRRKASENLD